MRGPASANPALNTISTPITLTTATKKLANTPNARITSTSQTVHAGSRRGGVERGSSDKGLSGVISLILRDDVQQKLVSSSTCHRCNRLSRIRFLCARTLLWWPLCDDPTAILTTFWAQVDTTIGISA